MRTATKRILVVDDSDFMRAVVKMTLQRTRGWEVLTASSGAEGLEQAVSAAPDAILLDMVMPDVDGPAALRKLRDNPSTQDIPVIFLTAREGASDPSEFAALGAAAVIAKPFDPAKLAGQVGEVLGWDR